MASVKDSLFVKVLRVWVGLVGVTALGNTISSYLHGELLSDTIFTQKPDLGKSNHSFQDFILC